MKNEINDSIFRELLKRGYKVEGKTRVWNIADSKLWYLTPEQAQGFLDLEKTKGYRESIIDREVSLIKQNLSDIISKLQFKSCNIIDLGCGDGKKASLFIDEMTNHIEFRYCPIDISSYMVSKAAETIRKLNVGEVVEMVWNISDFENLDNVSHLFRKGKFNNHFMTLLGNTLGNFDRDDILSGIRNSMEGDDMLLIGMGLSNGKNANWVKEYKDEKINKWLIKILLLIGFNKSQIDYDVRFVNSRIEEMYILKKDKTITHLGRKIEFKKGDVIIVAISYKYTLEVFKKLIKRFFKTSYIYTDKEKTYVLALVKK